MLGYLGGFHQVLFVVFMFVGNWASQVELRRKVVKENYTEKDGEKIEISRM